MTRRGRRRQSGATLISALVAMFILAAGMTIVLQTYVVGARSLRLTTQRDAAAAALEAQLETILASGYAQLPATGAYPIPPTALRSLPGAKGEMTVVQGPAPDTRTVSAEITWDDGGPRRERLAMVIAKRGVTP